MVHSKYIYFWLLEKRFHYSRLLKKQWKKLEKWASEKGLLPPIHSLTSLLDFPTSLVILVNKKKDGEGKGKEGK